MDTTIILVGPMGVGKSTVGERLATLLDITYVPVDEVCWEYYKEIGYDSEQVKKFILSEKGFAGFVEFMKPFEVYAVERVLTDYRNCVLDFGAGHVVHKDAQLFARVQQALSPFPNVVLLLPSADLDESVKILQQRILKRIEVLGDGYRWALDENKHFVTHPSNQRLAKIIVYTKGKTPEETCDEVLQQLQK